MPSSILINHALWDPVLCIFQTIYIYIYVVISSIYIISIYTSSYICSYKFHSSETFKLWPIYLTLCVITCLPRQERLLLTIQHSTIIGPIKHNCYCCSVSKLCPDLCDPMNCSTPGFPLRLSPWVCSNLRLVILSNSLICCHPLLLPSIFPSIRVFIYVLILSTQSISKYWGLFEPRDVF